MPAQAEQLKAALINEVVRRIRAATKAGADPIERFARRTYEGVAPELLLETSAEALSGTLLSLWRFAARRVPGAPKIRVYNPTHEEHGWSTTHTVVEIVNDDMPFIVDSVVAALNRQDLIVHLLVHPIVRVRRDAEGKLEDVLADKTDGGTDESILHVQISQRAAPAALDAIGKAVSEVLAEVRLAVEDWRAMRGALEDAIAQLAVRPPKIAAEELEEGKAFLEWIRDDNFTFLGVRDYALETKDAKDYLRIVPESGKGVLRAVSAESARRQAEALAPDMAAVARTRSLLIITKANTRSRVHRPVYMDYIGVRRFNAAGEVIGERRFVGLFTSSAYNRNPKDIPLLRRKVRQVIERSGFAPGSHNAKAILNILETYPRDELFQISAERLYETAKGILHLEERQRVRLFVRQDSYARFYSCLVYVPRERYTTALRQRLERILLAAFQGETVDFNTHISDAPMARVHFIVRAPRVSAAEVDVAGIEARLAESSRLWADDLQDALIERLGEARGHDLFHRYREAFPVGYQDMFSAQDAAGDIERCETVAAGAPIAMSLYRRVGAGDGELNFKLFHGGAPVPLSDILPMLEHMGLKVVSELPFAVVPRDSDKPIFIHDFQMAAPGEIDLGAVRGPFQEAFARIWAGEMVSDALNRLVVSAGFAWRDVVLLRAYTRYLRQARAPFSQAYIEDTLARHGATARLMANAFHARFDPDTQTDADARMAAVTAEIERALDKVANLDEDRILRRVLNLIHATLRTNFFQTGADRAPKPYLSFKFDSRKIDELPLPRPWVEVFVYSPRMEGIHLRGGKVARGGIRWSDRREDYRTEILGLMKAQVVKNAVIVPVGSKGGFVVKRPPKTGGREALQAEVVACYQMLMRGLLDLTDNLKGSQVIPPPRVVRLDDDDPYLVVAADKGTATFSDIANAVSREYGFWLDDAFASGGSAGYDHKKMGITAKGGWVSVERHFREMGRDVAKEPFTCVGVGDMAGDVFGNGMLRSRAIRLVGAFNHMHIFLDPDPDPEASFKERQRMFDLPRSTWADYDAALISKGGGVFARDVKSIRLSPEVKALLKFEGEQATPAEVIRALLKLEVDLLWFGGIGTFVKSSEESHADAGDRANDAIRVDGREIGARMVGEGANLGFTQRARIEYAQKGGRINTDAIDNSGGVDCSDHEVNIKILLGDVVQAGDMTLKQRDQLLERMTDAVSELVLKDNYQQTQALTVMAARGPELLEQQARMMRALERAGRLDRAIEYLPDEETIAERRMAGQGLVRPELAVLMAYGKIALYDELLASDLPDDPLLVDDLVRYFPAPLQEAHKAALLRHRLRREIIANVVTNSMVNRVGASFVHHIREKTGHGAAEIARAYAVTRDAFDLRGIWRAVEALDGKVPAALQTQMFLAAGRLVERGVFWFLANVASPIDVAATAAEYRPGIQTLTRALDGLLSQEREERFRAGTESLVAQGVPAELARRVAALEELASAPDIVRIARQRNVAVERVAQVYFTLGARLGLDWLRASAGAIKTETAWQRTAVEAVMDDLFGQQSELTARVLDGVGTGQANGVGANGVGANGMAAAGAVESWLAGRAAAVARTDGLLAELRTVAGVDLAMLAVANRQLRTLIA
ncbi:MAG: NAD-glutamate dehydrogenase [Alphaproteobacteria bacterium]|nr:NAD-glutamate dehydrogenase [Alphaproteobacteria bacterium]